MRKQFVACKDRRTAFRRCPWTAVLIKVDGGFMCFESFNDWRIWDRNR
jgi:hypothetical protein